jgi:hypothetical protein
MNKNQWMDALTLWWSITWRLWLSLPLLLLVFFGLIYLFDTPVSYQEYQSSAVQMDITLGSETQYYIGSGLLNSMFPLVFIIAFYLIGWSGKHALNNPLGKREFPVRKIIDGTEIGAGDASWVDGFILQWGVCWRSYVILILLAFILLAPQFVALSFANEVGVGFVQNPAIENAPQSLVRGLFQFVLYVLIGPAATRWLIAKPIGRTTFLVQLKQ